MNLGSVVAAIVLAVLVGLLLSSPRNAVPGAGRFEIVGRMAPDFSLSGPQGTWSLGEHLGKPLVLAFWTTWCGACIKDLDVLEAFHRLHGAEYEVVGICPEDWREVPHIIREHGVTFPVLHDPGEGVTREYERSEHLRYPFTVFVGPEGRVRCVWAYMLRDLNQLSGLLARCGLQGALSPK